MKGACGISKDLATVWQCADHLPGAPGGPGLKSNPSYWQHHERHPHANSWQVCAVRHRSRWEHERKKLQVTPKVAKQIQVRLSLQWIWWTTISLKWHIIFWHTFPILQMLSKYKHNRRIILKEFKTSHKLLDEKWQNSGPLLSVSWQSSFVEH